MFRKPFGIALYFLSLGFWIILLVLGIIWLSITVVPTIIIGFIIGYLTNIFKKRDYWPEFVEWENWEKIRTTYFNFKELNKCPMYNKPVIYAIYPHGHFSFTAVFYWALNPNRFINCKAAVHSALFWLPGIGSLAGWIGAIPVMEDEMVKTLVKDKKSIFMCPGGVAEIELTKNQIVKRWGFLRIARETNTPVIPVWCPDERSYYSQWLPFGYTLKDMLFFPIPMFIWGKWWCPILPKKPAESRIIFGKPVVWHKGKKSLEEGHNEFYKNLKDLF